MKKPSRKNSLGTAKKAVRKQSASKCGRMAAAVGRPAVEIWLARAKPELQPLVRRLDRLILEAMPDAVCAVKWGTPFYGRRGQGWIAAINAFKAHVKLLFFRGGDLKPRLPAGKEHKAIDFRAEGGIDEKQVKAWLRQAKKLPGWLRI
jgi:hypothetical protein